MDQGERDRALRYSWKALRIYDETRNWKSKARQLVRLALIYRELGELEMAHSLVSQARREHEAASDECVRAHIRACLGLIYKDQGDLRNALKHLKWAHEVFQRETGDLKEEANVKSEIAIMEYELKEYRRSPLVTLKAALELHQRIGFRKGEATTLGYMGRVLLHKGELEDALKHSRAALKLHMRTKNERGMAAMYDQVGLIELKSERPAEAEKSLQQARRLHKAIGDCSGEAATLLLMGMAKFDLKDMDGARRLWAQVEKVAGKNGVKMTQALQLACQGAAHSQKGDFEEAFKDLRSAARIGKGVAFLDPRIDHVQNMWTAPAKAGKGGPNKDFCEAARAFYQEVGDHDDWTRSFAEKLCELCKRKDPSTGNPEETAESDRTHRFTMEPLLRELAPKTEKSGQGR